MQKWEKKIKIIYVPQTQPTTTTTRTVTSGAAELFMRAERNCKGAQCLQNSLTQHSVCFQSRPVHELQPQTYTLQEGISLSMAPTWSEEGKAPR